jgi:hypothetical protein
METQMEGGWLVLAIGIGLPVAVIVIALVFCG